MDSENEQQFEDLPARLVAELKSADVPVSLITSRVDREISRLAGAQVHIREVWLAAAGAGPPAHWRTPDAGGGA